MVVHRSRLIPALAGLMAIACQRERPGIPPQHVFLVTVENLRADHCSFLMHDRPTTWIQSDTLMREEYRAFGIDDLAQDGVAFANAFAPSPVRDVSLATLLSSLPPLEHGVTQPGDRLPGEIITVGEAFRAGGFATAAYLAGAHPPDDSFARGFTTIESSLTDLEALRAAARRLGRDPGAGERTFVWVHLAGLAPPWTPREPSPEADAILAGRIFADPEYAGPIDGTAGTFQRLGEGAIEVDEDDRAALRDLYDAQLAFVSAVLWTGLHDAYDFHTGSAEASETWSRTVFALAGLNGIELLERGAVGTSGILSDATLRVPIVLRHPDSLTGERIFDDIVGLDDLAPTLLEWLRLPPLPDARGRSLLAVTDSYVRREFPARHAYGQLPDRGVFTVRDERWRLVWNPLGTVVAGRAPVLPPVPYWTLHDMRADPGGVRDVASHHPKVAERLAAAAKTWRERTRVFPAEKRPERLERD